MDKRPQILLWIFASLSLLELYSLFNEPQHWVESRRFLFNNTPISFQAWVDYAATRTMVISFLFIFRALLPFYYRELTVFIWLFVGYLVDYFVMYNNAVFKIGSFPVSYTLFMLIIAAVNVYNGFRKTWKI